MINDESYYVRKEVAKQGYGLDVLLNDIDSRVREIALKKTFGISNDDITSHKVYRGAKIEL